jgi:hypothetical protein
MPFESFARTTPMKHWLPINNDHYNWHCANPHGLFRNLTWFTKALEARFGNSTTAQQFFAKSQLQVM